MKKGISLIVLIITVGVIITLVSTIVVSGTNVYNNSKKVKFASEISYVEEMIKSYLLTTGQYPVLDEVNFSTLNIDDDTLLEQFDNESIIDSNIKLFQIDFSKLGVSEITLADKTYNDSDNIYLLSKTTGKVYYKKGYKVDKNIYYTLTDELKKVINYVENNNVNDGIIFSYNDNSPKASVWINIKIPKMYTDISITSTDSSFLVEPYFEEGEYNTYKTTSSSNNSIIIKYKINSEDGIKTLKYNVENVDNTAPTFELSDIITMDNSTTGTKEKYVKVSNLNDNISGIKFIKYENKKIEQLQSKEYFKVSGFEIKDNIIQVEDNISCITVYAEDNAGNNVINYINIVP